MKLQSSEIRVIIQIRGWHAWQPIIPHYVENSKSKTYFALTDSKEKPREDPKELRELHVLEEESILSEQKD